MSTKTARLLCGLGLILVLSAPRDAAAELSAAVGWIDGVMVLAEAAFPDFRVEVDDRSNFGAVLAWPVLFTAAETDDHLAAVELFVEPQFRVDHIDLRLAGGARANWNVFDLYGVLDDAGLFAEAGAIYDDHPAGFVGGGLGTRPGDGLGVALMYRRVWTFEGDVPGRHDVTVDLFWNFED